MALKVAIQFVEVTGREESLMIMIIDQLCHEKTFFLRQLISTFVFHCLNRIISLISISISKISSF